MSWLLTLVLVSSVAGCTLGHSYRLRFQGTDTRHRPPNYCWARRRLDFWANFGSLCAFADLWFMSGWWAATAWLLLFLTAEITVQNRAEQRFLSRVVSSMAIVSPEMSQQELLRKATERLAYAKQLNAHPDECL